METPRIAAAKKGERKYHGKPCRNCGNTERLTTTGACVICNRRCSKQHRDDIRKMLVEAESSPQAGVA